MGAKTLKIENEINENDFFQLAKIIYKITGISLDNSKKLLVINRFTPHRNEIGIDTWSEYIRELETKKNDYFQVIIDLITTNKTEFFRESLQFAKLEDIIKENIYKDKELFFWSAGCSRGHEVYSIDMFLRELYSNEDVTNWKILGTDINSKVLTEALEAQYSQNEISTIPSSLVFKYFSKSAKDNMYKYKTSGMDNIKLRMYNLLYDNSLSFSFDFIFLRNVLIYFNEQDREEIVFKMWERLRPEGYLFVGLSEHLKGNRYFEYLGNSIYRKIEKATDPLKSVRKKVLLVDDSKYVGSYVKKILSKDPRYIFMGQSFDTKDARIAIESKHPDIILLDINMPGENGDVFYKNYLKQKNIPTLIFTSLSKQDGDCVLGMLENGVSDYVQKPAKDNLLQTQDEILFKLNTALTPTKGSDVHLSQKKLVLNMDQKTLGSSIIAIGASTGGTVALTHIIPSLPEVFPPVVIVQHIPKEFSQAFANRLNSLCPFEVKEAVDGEKLLISTVYVAPGGKQLKIVSKGRDHYINVCDDPPINRHSPSVDYLFDSLKHTSFEKIVSVILTGMGKDGAREMLELKKLGHKTIGQTEKTCAVYGMPKAARELGAVDTEVDLNDILKETFKYLSNNFYS